MTGLRHPSDAAQAIEGRRIAEILDGFGDAFVAFGHDWKVAHCNATAEHYFGVPGERIIGRNIWELYPVATDTLLRRFIEGAMASGEPGEVEVPSEIHSKRWVRLRAFRTAVGLGVSFRDVTERRERQLQEREQAERLELALATSGFGDWSWDRLSDRLDLSARAAEMVGLPGGGATTGETLLAHVHPEDRELARLAMAKAAATSAPYQIECRFTRPGDGAERWLMIRARAREGDDGRPAGLLGVLMDVTDAKAAESRIRADRARLADLERRRAYLLEIADALRLLEDPDEVLSTASRMMAERLGVARMGYAEMGEDERLHVRGEWSEPGFGGLSGRSFALESFGPALPGYLRRGLDLAVDDATIDPRTAEAAGAFAALGVRAVIVTPLVREGRLDAVFYAHHTEPRAWTREDVALMEDVASRTWSALSRARIERLADERQRLLINELNHRVKNTLATIQSLARQTLRDGVAMGEARERLTERLLALSAAHNVLTRRNWESADITEIAQEAIRPYDDLSSQRITLTGPRSRLAPNVALAISMALHELATNAVKYGALSTSGGRVAVTWRLDTAEEWLELEWREAGGPRVAQPKCRGFGSRLISSLAGELGAPAQITYAPEGVVCRIRTPAT